ncbi:MAG: alpha/beta hydrolase [Lachnospiraceae bacterium]|nr:alpha/beta hydrolase [Lachnospiraceae bacterium]
MQIEQIQITDMSCNLFLPKGYCESDRNYPVIYVNGEIPVEEIVTELDKSGQDTDFILLSVKPKSWNDDFTPWSASAFRKDEEAPLGRADIYIACLTEEIKPYMDRNYRTRPEPEHTILLGYSLGGLTALYAVYKTDLFGTIGSLSGSLWYDGFCEFMEGAMPLRKDIRVYLSLGKKERLSRNPRMSKVAECTEKARDILVSQLGAQSGQPDVRNVSFEWNDGGHFHDIPRRFARAVIWCISCM